MFRSDCAVFCMCITMMVLFTQGQGQVCNLGGIQVCMYHEKIRIPLDVLKFIPASKFDDTCRQRNVALSCALKEQYVGGCNYKSVVSLRVQDDVRKVICEDRAKAYKRSSECFGQEELENEVLSCVTEFERERYEKCPALENAVECVKGVLDGFDVCDEGDKKLMELLVDTYLRPFADPEMYGCDMPPLEGLDQIKGQEEATTTTEMTTTEVATTEMTTDATTAASELTTKDMSDKTLKPAMSSRNDNNAAVGLGQSYGVLLLSTALSTVMVVRVLAKI